MGRTDRMACLAAHQDSHTDIIHLMPATKTKLFCCCKSKTMKQSSSSSETNWH